MVQEYLNEIAPTIYGPNKPKTSGKPLRTADLQHPASGQDKPDTLYTGLDEADVPGPEAGEVGVVLPQPRDRARRYGLHRRAEPHRGVGVGAAA